MDHTSFGRVVGSLQLRDVDDVATHGSSGNEATVGEILQLVAVQVGSLLLLASPVSSGVLGTVEGTVKVSVDNIEVVLLRAIDHSALGPWDTSVGNEDIEATIEFLDGEIDGFLDGLDVPDVDLVGLGCDRKSSLASYQKELARLRAHTGDTVLLRNLRGTVSGLVVAAVPEGDVGTSLCESVGNLQTDTSARTGNNGRLALEREEREDTAAVGSSGVVVLEDTVLDWRGGHCERQ